MITPTTISMMYYKIQQICDIGQSCYISYLLLLPPFFSLGPARWLGSSRPRTGTWPSATSTATSKHAADYQLKKPRCETDSKYPADASPRRVRRQDEVVRARVRLGEVARARSLSRVHFGPPDSRVNIGFVLCATHRKVNDRIYSRPPHIWALHTVLEQCVSGPQAHIGSPRRGLPARVVRVA